MVTRQTMLSFMEAEPARRLPAVASELPAASKLRTTCGNHGQCSSSHGALLPHGELLAAAQREKSLHPSKSRRAPHNATARACSMLVSTSAPALPTTRRDPGTQRLRVLLHARLAALTPELVSAIGAALPESLREKLRHELPAVMALMAASPSRTHQQSTSRPVTLGPRSAATVARRPRQRLLATMQQASEGASIVSSDSTAQLDQVSFETFNDEVVFSSSTLKAIGEHLPSVRATLRLLPGTSPLRLNPPSGQSLVSPLMARHGQLRQPQDFAAVMPAIPHPHGSVQNAFVSLNATPSISLHLRIPVKPDCYTELSARASHPYGLGAPIHADGVDDHEKPLPGAPAALKARVTSSCGGWSLPPLTSGLSRKETVLAMRSSLSLNWARVIERLNAFESSHSGNLTRSGFRRGIHALGLDVPETVSRCSIFFVDACLYPRNVSMLSVVTSPSRTRLMISMIHGVMRALIYSRWWIWRYS